jgi:hypothetical protein
MKANQKNPRKKTGIFLDKDLFFILVFFPLVEKFFGELPGRLNHIGNEGKDDKLQSDQKQCDAENQVVPITSDVKIGEVVEEKNPEGNKGQENQEQSRHSEKFHRPDIANGF